MNIGQLREKLSHFKDECPIRIQIWDDRYNELVTLDLDVDMFTLDLNENCIIIDGTL